jgi:hypothetical protein
MPSTKILEILNREILAEHGINIGKKEYRRIVVGRIYPGVDISMLDLYEDISLHYNEFYVHHSQLCNHGIISYDNYNIKGYLTSKGLIEGDDYICVSNCGKLFSEYKHVMVFEKNSYDNLASFKPKYSNWKIACIESMMQKISEYNQADIKRIDRCYEHFILTPIAFMRILSIKNANAMNDYMIGNIITEGYAMYVKLYIYLYSKRRQKEKAYISSTSSSSSVDSVKSNQSDTSYDSNTELISELNKKIDYLIKKIESYDDSS